jgi:hypothetical protein
VSLFIPFSLTACGRYGEVPLDSAGSKHGSGSECSSPHTSSTTMLGRLRRGIVAFLGRLAAGGRYNGSAWLSVRVFRIVSSESTECGGAGGK